MMSYNHIDNDLSEANSIYGGFCSLIVDHLGELAHYQKITL